MIKGWLNPQIDPERALKSYASTGNSKYLTLLVEHFNLSLYHYVLSQSDQELAEDIIQSVWLKVMHATRSTNEHTNVKSWLFTIARNTLIDELRRQQRWQWQELSEHYLSHEPVEQVVSEADRLTQFNYAITQLSFYQREAFIFQQEGFSVLEICQLTNESYETIKSRLRYARNNIKSLLGTQA